MNHSTQKTTKRKPASVKASPQLEPKESTQNAESFAGHESYILGTAPQKTQAEKLALLDQVFSEFDRKVDWVSSRIYRSLNADRWMNCWNVHKVKRDQREEFEQIIAHLRSRDPVLRRAIEGIEWQGQGATVLLHQGGASHE